MKTLDKTIKTLTGISLETKQQYQGVFPDPRSNGPLNFYVNGREVDYWNYKKIPDGETFKEEIKIIDTCRELPLNKQRITIVKELPKSFFEQMEIFLWDQINVYRAKGVEWNKIQIYIPNYLYEMWVAYAADLKFSYDFNGTKQKFVGIEIIDNYQNNVIVTHKGMFYAKHTPAVLEIP